ncbi:MAG: glycosyltransferase family 61 protein, partial [Bacteroidota bacterium]|nr:glycosyltransferase family 61 protein [Bacteroidota bacterium]
KYNCRFVYISRNDSQKRRVLNEEALMQTIGKYGFQSFKLSNLSFQEKITLFSNAEIIVATIGAGQINLVFCKKNTHVIELMAEDFAQPIFNDLANKVGVKYDYLICKSGGKAHNFKQGEKLNLIVNIEEVERKLKRIIALEKEAITN